MKLAARQIPRRLVIIGTLGQSELVDVTVAPMLNFMPDRGLRVNPAVVVQRIVIHDASRALPESYLGPPESYSPELAATQ